MPALEAGWRSWVKPQSSLCSFSKTFGLEFRLNAFESFPLCHYRLWKEYKTKHKQGYWSNSATIYLVEALLLALCCDLLCSGPNEMCFIYKKYWIFREACCVHTNPELQQNLVSVYVFLWLCQNSYIIIIKKKNQTVRLLYSELRMRQKQGETLFWWLHFRFELYNITDYGKSREWKKKSLGKTHVTKYKKHIWE